MGELLNREVQTEILRGLASAYPQSAKPKRIFDFDENVLAVNIAYMEELGFINANWYGDMNLGKTLATAKITASGLDFLQGDGGLTAMLNVITVRLHDDTLKELIIGKINSSDADAEEKRGLIKTVKEMPEDALKLIGTKIVEAGIAAAPDGFAALRGYLGI